MVTGTGNHAAFNPAKDGCNNTQHIATWFPPTSGAFASYNAAHVARDVALMKQYCVDGVILDYQQPPVNDPSRSVIDAALPVVAGAIVDAGLELAIMYDTSSLPNWGRGNPQVQADWRRIVTWSGTNFSSAYARDADGNRMYFGFGATPLPQRGSMACSDCSFYAQDGRLDTGIDGVPGVGGAFAWVEPQAAGGKPLSYLQSFYSEHCDSTLQHSPTPCVGAAFAGFKAVYPQYGSIPRNASLLRQGLELCRQHSSSSGVCQVPTWNDYNEGTHVQPSYWCDGQHNPPQFLQVIHDFKTTAMA